MALTIQQIRKSCELVLSVASAICAIVLGYQVGVDAGLIIGTVVTLISTAGIMLVVTTKLGD